MSDSSGHWRRRDLLRAGGTVLASAFFPQIGQTAISAPATQFPTEPNARLAVTSYPFRAYIQSPTNPGRNPKLPAMDMTDFPRYVSEHFGVFNINPLLAHFNATDPAYLNAFRRALEQARSHIVDLGLGGKQFYAIDPSFRQQAVDYGRHGIDVAAQVGSPSVRQHVGGKGKPDVALAAESLARLADYGARQNVVVNLENDDPVAEDPFFLVSVIEKVNNPYLRALPDFGNSLAGHNADYNRRAISAMLPHAYNMCHVKDVVADRGRQVPVDLAALFKLAKEASYKGYFSMEFETEGGDPVAGTKRLIAATLRYLSRED